VRTIESMCLYLVPMEHKSFNMAYQCARVKTIKTNLKSRQKVLPAIPLQLLQTSLTQISARQTIIKATIAACSCQCLNR
jgi:hypothetical protein